MRITFVVLAALSLTAACHSRNPGWGTPPPVTQPPNPPKPPRDFCKNLPEPEKTECYTTYPGGTIPPVTTP